MWGTSSSSKTLDLTVAGVVAITHASIDRLVLPLSSLLLDLTKQQSIVQLAGRSPLGQALAVDTWLGAARAPRHVLRVGLAARRLARPPVLPAQLRAVVPFQASSSG